jgi:hypothetical protein
MVFAPAPPCIQDAAGNSSHVSAMPSDQKRGSIGPEADDVGTGPLERREAYVGEKVCGPAILEARFVTEAAVHLEWSKQPQASFRR